VRKAKQIEFIIDALPVPEPEAQQAARLAKMEEELELANAEYNAAAKRARKQLTREVQGCISDQTAPLHVHSSVLATGALTAQVTILLRALLSRNTISQSHDATMQGELSQDDDAMDQDPITGSPPPRTPPPGTPPNRTGRGPDAGWKPPTPHVATPETVSDGLPDSPWVKGTELPDA